ncbi:MAG: NAD(P)H-dependent oxidoreductase [Methanothrix sp.]|nr:NAD(P)H-dependent oxidoreductase [Methanothrix sp.]
MRISVILAHPHPGSFNHAIAKIAVQTLEQNDHQVTFHDLYQECFDPILRFAEIPRDAKQDDMIQIHCQELALADGINNNLSKLVGHASRYTQRLGGQGHSAWRCL